LNSGRAIAIVPVRLGSSRLPGKALLDESGLPLFAHTVQAARRSEKLDDVVVATDSPEVLRKGEELGIHCLETSEHPRTGSERCAEALAQLPDAEIVIDVQGDWPEVHGKDLDALVKLIFVTGGVVSSLGKGIASASLGALLEARGCGHHDQARSLHQRRPGHHEPVPARRGLRHRRRCRDRPGPRSLRALPAHAHGTQQQLHHRADLRERDPQGAPRRLPRAAPCR
jgi:hypothetical protein